MDIVTLALFVPACFALNMAPGPNNLLAMRNAQHFGLGQSLLGGIGRLVAFGLMIFLAATGLAVVLLASERLFLAIKIVGALYLFWTAFQLWRAPVDHQVQTSGGDKSGFRLAQQEFLLAAGNPKAILIFTAFLPQFIDPLESPDKQFLVLGGAFLMLEFVAITLYGVMGIYLRNWFEKPQMKLLFNRTCAGFIAILGVGMLKER